MINSINEVLRSCLRSDPTYPTNGETGLKPVKEPFLSFQFHPTSF
jgi:hypothetical protein